MKRVLEETKRRRNLITIRLSDVEMRAIVDSAWQQKRSVADLARESLFAHLKAAYNIELQEVQAD